MNVSVSLLVLLLIVAAVMMRSGTVKASHAVVYVLLGFLLASTGVAPAIENSLTETARVVSAVDL